MIQFVCDEVDGWASHDGGVVDDDASGDSAGQACMFVRGSK